MLLFVELDVVAGAAAAAGAGELSLGEELAESDVDVEVVFFESVEDLESPMDLGLALP